jgi:DegV family protein with EDD domain
MKKVAILTDSTAYIPAAQMELYPIFTVPLGVVWGSETFEDGVDITPRAFYERLKTAATLPTTSQPSVGSMQAAMHTLLAREYDILGIFISSHLSGTHQSAVQAQTLLPAGSQVKIFDSESTTLALGFQILAAARAAQQGASLAECFAAAEKARHNSGVYFMVDTLEFLHRGGRIGGAQRFLGTALKMKPILYMHKGKIESLERVRTKGKALERLVDLVEEKCAGKSDVRLAGIHANAFDDANWVLENATARLSPIETLVAELSPVVGTHAGPGTVALAYQTGN